MESRAGIWNYLDVHAKGALGLGMGSSLQGDFEQQIDGVLAKAEAIKRTHDQMIAHGWKFWAEAAFEGGASRARKFSKPQSLQEIIDLGEGVQRAYQLTYTKLEYWNGFW
eukprot:5104955-Pyramimonas_sp.AAC.1